MIALALAFLVLALAFGGAAFFLLAGFAAALAKALFLIFAVLHLGGAAAASSPRGRERSYGAYGISNSSRQRRPSGA